MSERSRARVLAGSMSAITAATVTAALLGASVAVTLGFGVGRGAASGTVQFGSGRGPAASTATRAGSPRAVRRSAAAHPAATSAHGRPRRGSSNDGPPAHRVAPPGERSPDAGASVSAGPVRASTSAGPDGVAATAEVGPLEKTVKVCPLLSC